MALIHSIKNRLAQLAGQAPAANKGKIMDRKLTPTIIPKTISQTRADMATWQSALKAAGNADNPKRVKLQQLYDQIMVDALLTSQLNNRVLNTLGSSFAITDANGKENEDITLQLSGSKWLGDIVRQILYSQYYGYSVVELSNDKLKGLQVTELPRTNIEPVKGLFYPDYTNDTATTYRTMPEYGIWILEFNNNDYGLLNKAIPHVLFKRFAQSCWSELCEIYGIPPRVMKTQTDNPAALDRAEQMMRDMGSAAWFVIDETEAFEFADGISTNGDVYKNLIQLCNQEMSLLINGAIIGQDTAHGNRSKEESSIGVMEDLIAADKMMVQHYCNMVVFPAMAQIGILPAGMQLVYKQAEDKEALWKKVVEVLPHKEVDDAYIKDNFGIEVTAKKVAEKQTLSDFFTEGLDN